MSKQALAGTRLNAFGMDPDTLLIVGLDVEGDDAHPLADPHRNKLPIEEGMVLNIIRYGVIKPVVVRKDGDKALVVDGRRRVRHAREANKRLKAEGAEPILVPVIVRKADDLTIAGVSRSANQHTVADDPLAKSDEMARLAGQGLDAEGIAVIYGTSAHTVRSYLRLSEVSPEVRKAVKSEAISATAAAKLAGLSREEQESALAELTEAGETEPDGKPRKATAAKAAKAAKKARAKNGKDTKSDDTGAGTSRGVREIRKALKRVLDNPLRMPTDEKTAVVAALEWVLGSEMAEYPEEDKLVRTLQGRG